MNTSLYTCPMTLSPSEGDKRPTRRKTATNVGLTELASLHRSLKTPSSLTLRPGSSWRCNTTSLRLPPPTPYLPPYAPPQPDPYVVPPEPLKFPVLPCKPAVRNRRQKPARTRGRSRVEARAIVPLRVDVQTETDPPPGQLAFICRLCGLNCPSGDILHAHILLLKHSRAKEVLETGEAGDVKPAAKGTRLFCRRCGACWNTAEDKDDVKCHTHPCILQKAAYFKNFLAPESKICQGLPFVCLLCCTEAEDAATARWRPPPGRRGPRRSNKNRPLRPHHTAARFASKLHLAVHIIYFHAPTRSPGHCIECPDFAFDAEKEEPVEFERWTREVPKSPHPPPAPPRHPVAQKPPRGPTSSSSSETEEEDVPPRPPSPTPSSCSILEREGLHGLDRHIEADHTPLYEYLAWQFTKHGLSDVAVHTSRSRTNWIYACPICQIQPFMLTSNVDPLGKGKVARPEYGMSGNAMLQAHLACFHAAGASFLDWKLQVCQVCGESLADSRGRRGGCCEAGELTSPLQRHLVRAGHLTRLKALFALAVRQGRLPEAGGWLQCVDWHKTCVLCWRKFGRGAEDHSRLGSLRAECQLQAHLISTHCVFGEERGEEKPTMACGWCGCMLLKEENRTTSEGVKIGDGNQRLNNRRESRANLLAGFQWALRHEEEHADALFRWWCSPASKKKIVV